MCREVGYGLRGTCGFKVKQARSWQNPFIEQEGERNLGPDLDLVGWGE